MDILSRGCRERSDEVAEGPTFEERMLVIIKDAYTDPELSRWEVKAILRKKVSWEDYKKLFIEVPGLGHPCITNGIGDLMIEYCQPDERPIVARLKLRKTIKQIRAEDKEDDDASEPVVCKAILKSGKRKGEECGKENCKVKSHNEE